MAWSPPQDIVGREFERAQLRVALNQVLSGHGQFVLVSGEAGIGKTALVRDFANYAEEQRCVVLRGGCYDLTRTPPYSPWIEAIEQAAMINRSLPIPAWASEIEGMEEARSQGHLFEEARRYVGELSARDPLVIVLEDLHWSDQGSLEMLRYLGRRVHELRMLVIATYRDDELSREHRLFQSLPYLIRESDALRIELAPLELEAIRQLTAPFGLASEDADRLVDYLHQRADGNPLFILELLRTLEAAQVLRRAGDGFELGVVERVQVPRLVIQLIERRLSFVPPETRRLIEIAAIIGEEIDIGLWAQVAECDEGALDQPIRHAIEATILTETIDGNGLRFTHALVREALYEGVVLSRRRTLHRRIAERLVDSTMRDPDAIAYHFERAADERALSWLVAGGLRARMASDYLSAADRFERAVTILAGDPERVRERGWLIQFIGELERYSTEAQPSRRHDEAYRLGTLVGDDLLRAAALGRRGGQHNLNGEFRLGMQKIEEAVAITDRLVEAGCEVDPNRAMRSIFGSLLPDGEAIPARLTTVVAMGSHHTQAIWLPAVGRYHDAIAVGEEFAGKIDNTAEGSLVGHMGLADAWSALGKPDRARRESSRMRRRALHDEEYLGLHTMTLIELWQIDLPFRTDHPEERRELLAVERAARERATDLGSNPARHAGCDALVAYIEGDWVAARALAGAILDSSLIIDAATGITITGILAREQGEPELAWEQIGKYLPDGPMTTPGGSYFLFASRLQRLAVDLALDAGDMELARAWLEAHDRWLAWSEAVLGQVEGQLGWSRYYLCEGNLDLALQHAETARDLASDPQQPLGLIAAHRILGSLCVRCRQYDETGVHLDESLRVARACAAPFEEALTLLEIAKNYAATGRIDLAQAALKSVRETCAPMRAELVLARAEDLSARIEPRKAKYPDGLTEREAEVLSLMAAGKSNRQIADALYLSIRTVERHISNIYRKIDAHNRTEATRYALQHHIIDLADS